MPVLLDKPERSAADYTLHGFTIGQNELAAIVADLGLDLESTVTSGKPR